MVLSLYQGRKKRVSVALHAFVHPAFGRFFCQFLLCSALAWDRSIQRRTKHPSQAVTNCWSWFTGIRFVHPKKLVIADEILIPSNISLASPLRKKLMVRKIPAARVCSGGFRVMRPKTDMIPWTDELTDTPVTSQR